MRVMKRDPPGCALAHPVQSYQSPSMRRRRRFLRLSFVAEASASASSRAGVAKGLRKAGLGPATLPRATPGTWRGLPTPRRARAGPLLACALAAAMDVARRICIAPRAATPAATRPAGATPTDITFAISRGRVSGQGGRHVRSRASPSLARAALLGNGLSVDLQASIRRERVTDARRSLSEASPRPLLCLHGCASNPAQAHGGTLYQRGKEDQPRPRHFPFIIIFRLITH